MYVSGRVDIFDMVDIDLFTVVSLNMMVLKLGYTGKFEPMFYNYLRPLTSLDEGLYALSCEEDVRCLATLVRSFKLIEVYKEHGVTALDSYLKAPQFRATIALQQIELEKCSIASQVIDDVMRQLSFEETKLDGEAGFADVAGSGVDSSGLSHDESFGVDDLDLNLNEPVNINVSQVETQSELPVFEEPDVGHTHVLARMGTHLWHVDYLSSGEDVKQYNGEFDESAPSDGQFFFDDEGIDIAYETEYDVHMDLPFDNIGVTNLVSGDVLEGEDVDVINADGFDSDLGNDEEKNYRNRRLAELRTEMEGVINSSGQWKYSFYIGKKFTTPKKAKDRVYLHSIESRRNLKLYKNDGVRIRARCDGKVPVFTMSQGTGPTGPNCGMEAGHSGSSSPSTRSKKRNNTCTNDDSQASSILNAYDKWDLCPWVLYVGKDKFIKNWVVKTHSDTHTCLQSREIKHYTYKFLSKKIFEQVMVNSDILIKAVQDQLQRELEVQISMRKALRAKAKAERKIRGDHVLHYSMLRDYVVELQSINPNTTVKITDERNTDPSLPTRVFQRIYICLGALKLGFRACRRDLLDLDGAFIKGSFPGQVLVAVGLDLNNGIYPLAYALVEAESRAKSDLLLNNICEVFNGKIVGGRDKPVITLLEYIKEYCMKRIMNVQGMIDKCTGPLTPITTKIMESIKKEAHLMKVQWNRENKYQVSDSFGDQCVVYVVSMTCSCTKWELTGIPCKHVVAACWNMAMNDPVAPPTETKKRKRSKHEDEPFMKDGKLSRKGRTITCQSCGNTGHNNATCKGQGGNNVEVSGSASRQTQQIKHTIGQDGLGGLGAGAVIGLYAATGKGGAGDASQGLSHSRWTKRIVQTERISPQKNSHSTYKSTTFYQFSSANE
ncbi:putative ribonuclease H-like domain-containing protein [Tanacetum coccineum]